MNASVTPFPSDLYRAAFERAMIGIACSSPDGTLLAVNPRLCEMLGRTREELLTGSLSSSLHPDDVHEDGLGTARLLDGECEAFVTEQRRVLPDGATRRMRLRRTLVTDAGARPAFLLSVIGMTLSDDPIVAALLVAQAAELEEQARKLESANVHLTASLRETERARHSAEAAEAEQRALIEAMRDVVLVLDADGRYVKVARTTQNLLAEPGADLIGRRMHDVLPAATADAVLVAIRESLATRDMVRVDYDLELEGRKVSFAAVISPMSDDRVVCVARDVTDRRRAAAALRDSEQRYRLLFDGNPMPMWVFEDDTLRFLDVNEAAMAQYGYSREEFLSMTIADIRPPEDAGIVRTVADAIVGRPYRSGGCRHRRKDGSLLSVEITAHSIDFGGKACKLILAHDVTAKEQVEAQARESGRMLAAALDDSPVAIVTVSTDSTITRWNAAAERMFGWTSADVLGRPYSTIVPPERTEAFLANWAQLLDHGSMPSVTTWYHHRDGTLIDVNVSVATLHDAEGTVNGAVLNLSDVTEHKRLEAQFRQAQKMEAIGQLAGGVAHDFNNLLTAIISYSDMLLQDVPDVGDAHGDLLEIKNAAERAGALTRQLLAFSRQQVLQPTILSPNTAVTAVEKMLRRLVREDISIVLDLDPALMTIEADAAQLEQVLINLVLNARDAIEGSGTITISTANESVGADGALQPDGTTIVAGPYAVLSVSDTGGGMTDEVRAHIFEPFFTTKAQGKGTGLGLSTVYGVVRQSAGNVRCESAPGMGATFSVHWPGAAATEVADTAPARKASSLTSGGHEVVLLVEDEELVRMVAARILTSAGYTVLEARNGRDAIELFAAHRDTVDLVVSDMVMPGMSGPELVDQLRLERPDLRVLFVSGYSRDAIEHRVVFASGSAYLEKPFTPAQLTAKVRELIERAEESRSEA